MQAVILAGGAGTRLYPLTVDIPKVMLEVNGKPFLDYVVSTLKKAGIFDFIFCVGYLADKIEDYFHDGSQFGLHITYSVEKEFLGTAGAVKLAEPMLGEDFFVINGDTYLPIDYALVYETFIKRKKNGLMVVYDNNENIAENNIALGEENLVLAYAKKEKLKKGFNEEVAVVSTNLSCQYIDAGVQVYSKSIMKLIPGGKFVSFEADLLPKLIQDKELVAYITNQRYYDLGTPERLKLVRKAIK